jgi:hypothetical protein
MPFETDIAWGCLALGIHLAMALVFDRERLLRGALLRGVFLGVYVIFCLSVR